MTYDSHAIIYDKLIKLQKEIFKT
uniref:Uncharacterized protein n=1 Tax=Anguilla anguilla TaxID=7936 RepID=A0A0E9TRK3_ANGAN